LVTQENDLDFVVVRQVKVRHLDFMTSN